MAGSVFNIMPESCVYGQVWSLNRRRGRAFPSAISTLCIVIIPMTCDGGSDSCHRMANLTSFLFYVVWSYHWRTWISTLIAWHSTTLKMNLPEKRNSFLKCQRHECARFLHARQAFKYVSVYSCLKGLVCPSIKWPSPYPDGIMLPQPNSRHYACR